MLFVVGNSYHELHEYRDGARRVADAFVDVTRGRTGLEGEEPPSADRTGLEAIAGLGAEFRHGEYFGLLFAHQDRVFELS